MPAMGVDLREVRRQTTQHNSYLLRIFESGDGGIVAKAMPRDGLGWRREVWARSILTAAGVGVFAPSVRIEKSPSDVTLWMRECVGVATLADLGSQNTISLASALAEVHAKTRTAVRETDRLVWIESLHECQRELASLGVPASLDAAVRVFDRDPVLAELSLVHRDLTEGNIFVGRERVRIIDWETATIAHADQDMVRLRSSLPSRVRESFDQEYERRTAELVGWRPERRSPRNVLAFQALHYAEMIVWRCSRGLAQATAAPEAPELIRVGRTLTELGG